MTLTDGIAAVQDARKALTGADGDVSTEKDDVEAEKLILARKQELLQQSIDADTAAKLTYKSALQQLQELIAAELAGLEPQPAP